MNVQTASQDTQEGVTVFPSSALTLMSTQDAQERTAAKGKAKEAQVVPPPAQSSPTKAQSATNPPAKAQAPMNPPAVPPPSKPAEDNPPTTATNTTAAPPPPADVPSVVPQKRGPGRPRKSEPTAPAGPPPPKRPRGRPRKTAPPATEPIKRSTEEDSEYQDSDAESTDAVPEHILTQHAAHIALLRTRNDTRGIPEQYSLFKSFWVPMRSSYFDGGACGTPARFVYWDPLYITSVACPKCSSPLAIAAGGGWLEEPLRVRDDQGLCWVIGRRYVCTECFRELEKSASNSTTGPDNKPKSTVIDVSNPVYYISWEKRFQDLLPRPLAAEFPTRSKRRATRKQEKDIEKKKEKADDSEEDAEGEIDLDVEESKRTTRRARHCMKCGSKACQGRNARSRCTSPCVDCGSVDCNGRPKPNVNCKGEVCTSFKELNDDDSGSAATEKDRTSATPAGSRLVGWSSGLPDVPPGFVLAIPYAVDSDGKPSSGGPGMAYLVPKTDVPGFFPATKPSAPEASGSKAPNAAPKPAPANSAQPAQPKPKNPPRTNHVPPKPAAQPHAQPSHPPAPAPPAAGAPSHPAPAHHPAPQHGAPYPPPYPPYAPPPHANGSEPGPYSSYYSPYGYPPPYGYGYYAPYPPPPSSGENGGPHPPPPSHAPYPTGPYTGYPPPPAAGGGNVYAHPPPHPPPAQDHAHPSAPPPAPGAGYAPPPPPPAPAVPPNAFPQQQYIAYKPPVPNSGSTVKKRKAPEVEKPA